MSVRELKSHMVNGMNKRIQVTAVGEPGAGGACLKYLVVATDAQHAGDEPAFEIRFQEGNPADGINGLTNEVLLAILEDRLLGFQQGKFNCRENSLALTKVQEAQAWLQRRTNERIAAGVEGTQTPTPPPVQGPNDKQAPPDKPATTETETKEVDDSNAKLAT